MNAYEEYLRTVATDCSGCQSGKCKDHFFGPFASIRATRDYSHHSNYPKERQELQDRIIADVLKDGCASERPHLLFTAGPMGAGKGYSLRHLAADINLSLDKYLLIDPDQLKERIPEFDALVRLDREQAGSRMHDESSFLQEIIFEVGLERRLNMIVDGSLRDVEWNSALLRSVRREHACYRLIEIFFVYAKSETILERALRRGAATGRFVPREKILATIRQVPKSIHMLRDLTDRTYYVHNEDTPEIEYVYEPPATSGKQHQSDEERELAAEDSVVRDANGEVDLTASARRHFQSSSRNGVLSNGKRKRQEAPKSKM